MMDLLPDLCDQHGDALQVAEPLFHDYGGKPLFYGEAVTLSCFEDNSLVRELVASPGHGKVMVIDGGGSLRRALLGDQLAIKAVEQGWEGILIHGAVRDLGTLAGGQGAGGLSGQDRETRTGGAGCGAVVCRGQHSARGLCLRRSQWRAGQWRQAPLIPQKLKPTPRVRNCSVLKALRP